MKSLTPDINRRLAELTRSMIARKTVVEEKQTELVEQERGLNFDRARAKALIELISVEAKHYYDSRPPVWQLSKQGEAYAKWLRTLYAASAAVTPVFKLNMFGVATVQNVVETINDIPGGPDDC